LALLLSGSGMAQTAAQDLTQADKLYYQGQFTEAALLYAQAAENDPAAYGAVLKLGRISLLRNDLEEAEKWLKKALALKKGATCSFSNDRQAIGSEIEKNYKKFLGARTNRRGQPCKFSHQDWYQGKIQYKKNMDHFFSNRFDQYQFVFTKK
ncbi:MAG: tetratricopeptide repeat protein, partial [Candidatus Aminicenantes bacterium]|nr:tetratricopeptide repeat protein [Candidatus Aminicenantes bacterium]